MGSRSKISFATCGCGLVSDLCVRVQSPDTRHVLSSQVNSVNNDGAWGNPEEDRRGPNPNLELAHACSSRAGSTLSNSSSSNGTAHDRHAQYGGTSDGRHHDRR